jgi:hypothetical protein
VPSFFYFYINGLGEHRIMPRLSGVTSAIQSHAARLAAEPLLAGFLMVLHA